MANQERGEIGVKVGGKDYTLRPSFNAACEFEDLTGKNFDDILASSETPLSNLRSVIWCLLQDEHADEIKTLKDAGQWIDTAGGAIVAMGYANRALLVNADAEGADEANPPNAQAGTGEISSSVLVETV